MLYLLKEVAAQAGCPDGMKVPPRQGDLPQSVFFTADCKLPGECLVWNRCLINMC